MSSHSKINNIAERCVRTAPRSTAPTPSDAWQALADVLGPEHVLDHSAVLDRYARSTGHNGTRPALVVYPASVEQVQHVVRVAGRYGLGLYPISRGRNWGYGDACAPREGQVIVDLQRMNRVIEVNPNLAYAVVEPGVTQRQLWGQLAENGTRLWMDATGAGNDTSVLGNILERGFGHTPYGDHAAAVCGIEVVLADGEILRTGFGHFPDAHTRHVYPHGLGPSLDGLFAQSNFGIVTRVGLWLMPEPEAFCAFFFSVEHDRDLAELVDRLASLRRRGLLNSAIHIGNDLRVISARMRYPFSRTGGETPLPPDVRADLRDEFGIGTWNGCGAIYGTPGTVRAVRAELKRAMGRFRPTFVTDRRLNWTRRLIRVGGKMRWAQRIRERLEIIEPAIDMLKGKPTNEPLRGAAWRVRDPMPDPGEALDPLDCHAGLMWAAPVVPMTGRDAAEVMRLIAPIYEAHGFEPLATFTMLTERAMICVSNLCFDTRDADEAARAAACHDELLDRLLDAGYPPYRASPADMERIARRSPRHWQTVARIKHALDPQNTISPGRYAAPDSSEETE